MAGVVATRAGLLLLDGLLLRRVGLDGRFGAELIGAGDLLRPWQREDAVVSLRRQWDWRVLKPTRIAVLDLEFAERVVLLPEITGVLLGRALRRARHYAVNMAIIHQPRVVDRLHILLWHLADRWGTVRPDGIFVPLTLTHTTLAELVAARRPTVSTAISELQRTGALSRTARGWLLHGEPPGELLEVSRAN